MKPITTKQFVWSLALTSAGFVLWLSPGEMWWQFAGGFFVIATLLEMPREERTRPLSALRVVCIFGLLALFSGVVLVANQWIPEQWGVPVMRVVRHPLLVVPLWALVAFFTYRRWRYRQTEKHAG